MDHRRKNNAQRQKTTTNIIDNNEKGEEEDDAWMDQEKSPKSVHASAVCFVYFVFVACMHTKTNTHIVGTYFVRYSRTSASLSWKAFAYHLYMLFQIMSITKSEAGSSADGRGGGVVAAAVAQKRFNQNNSNNNKFLTVKTFPN